MKSLSKSLEIKPLIVLSVAILVTIILSYLVSRSTNLLPKAGQPLPVGHISFPSPSVPVGVSPDLSLPTPYCRLESDDCITCCTKINEQEVCQETVCPVVKP